LAAAASAYAQDMRGTRARVLALIRPYLADEEAAMPAPKMQEAHDG
jgi:hypothetical protein